MPAKKQDYGVTISNIRCEEILRLFNRTELEVNEDCVDNTSTYIAKRTGESLVTVNVVISNYLDNKWKQLNKEVNSGERYKNTLHPLQCD